MVWNVNNSGTCKWTYARESSHALLCGLGSKIDPSLCQRAPGFSSMKWTIAILYQKVFYLLASFLSGSNPPRSLPSHGSQMICFAASIVLNIEITQSNLYRKMLVIFRKGWKRRGREKKLINMFTVLFPSHMAFATQAVNV